MRRALFFLVFGFFASGCSQPATLGRISGPFDDAIPNGAQVVLDKKIQHIFIIVQENRSFDYLFNGYPGANTQSYGYTSTGKKVQLQPIPLGGRWDLGHDWNSYTQACDGQGKLPGTNCKMDGFDREYHECGQPGKPKCPIRTRNTGTRHETT